jgi:hypothetical protein
MTLKGMGVAQPKRQSNDLGCMTEPASGPIRAPPLLSGASPSDELALKMAKHEFQLDENE